MLSFTEVGLRTAAEFWTAATECPGSADASVGLAISPPPAWLSPFTAAALSCGDPAAQAKEP
jgi:hypothetical protein